MTREIEISSDLQQCFLRTQTACVRECCGIDAFEPDAAVIGAWAAEVGQRRASSVLGELCGLLFAAEDRSSVVWSSFLNASTPTEESREKLLSFLKRYQATLSARVSIRVIALDLKATLIDNSLFARPRPGLLDFLAFCHESFHRIAVFTSVQTADAREILEGLDRDGYLPVGLLARLEYVEWCGEYKDLGFIPHTKADEVRLIDDDAGWVRPDQRDRWIPIAPWDGGADSELRRVRRVLEGWLARGTEGT